MPILQKVLITLRRDDEYLAAIPNAAVELVSRGTLATSRTSAVFITTERDEYFSARKLNSFRDVRSAIVGIPLT